MKNKKVITLATSICISAGIIGSVAVNQNVAAATMRTKRVSYVYNVKGHKTKQKIRKNKYVNATNIRTIHGKSYWKIGRNKYIRISNLSKPAKHSSVKDAAKYKPKVRKNQIINLDNHPTVPEAKDVVINADQLPAGTTFKWESGDKPVYSANGQNYGTIMVTYSDHSKDEVEVMYTFHGTNHIVIPSSYTAEGVRESESGPTAEMQKAAEKGENDNVFVSESEKDDHEKVNYRKLTDNQKEEVSQFALRLIN